MDFCHIHVKLALKPRRLDCLCLLVVIDMATASYGVKWSAGRSNGTDHSIGGVFQWRPEEFFSPSLFSHAAWFLVHHWENKKGCF